MVTARAPAPLAGRPGTVAREFWLPGLVFSLLAITLRLLVAARREGIEIDGITYLRNAQALLRGTWEAIDVLHPPLYSVLLAPTLALWGDPEWGARVTSAVLGGLWVWPTLWLAREVTDERVAWPAGLLVALMPAAVEAGTRVLAEATFGLFFTAFLASCVRTLRTRSLHGAALTGALGGLATLARPEGMVYLALAWGVLLLAPRLAGARWTFRLTLSPIAVVTTLWLVVLAPYMLLVRGQTGHWQWSGKMGITLSFAESVGDERQASFFERSIAGKRPEELEQGLLDSVLRRPGAAARRVALNLHHMDKYVLSALLQTGGVALVVLGLLHLRFRRAPAPPEWFLAVAPLPLGGLLLFIVSPRYFVALLPLFSIIAAIGVSRLGRGRTEAAGERHGPSGLGVLVLAIVLVSFVPWIIRPWFRQDPGALEKAAGLWLRRTAGPGIVFIGTYGRIGYYAEGRAIPFGSHPLEALLAEGRRAGARFLIADTGYLLAARPDLMALAAGSPAGHPELELAQVLEDRAGNRLNVYRIRST
jgi:4-amino-4-deoxy-L-arabinose transferase-like glycosyltransferase